MWLFQVVRWKIDDETKRSGPFNLLKKLICLNSAADVKKRSIFWNLKHCSTHNSPFPAWEKFKLKMPLSLLCWDSRIVGLGKR